MVIYENGQRELFREVVNKPTLEDEHLIKAKERSGTEEENFAAEYTVDAPFPHNPNEEEIMPAGIRKRVQYRPMRISVGLEPFQLGMDTEFMIIKNAFNFGFGYLYYFPDDLAIVSSQHANVYGSLYLPVNLLLENYEK